MENSATKLKNENNPPEKVMDRFTRFQNERTLSDRQYRDVRLSVSLLDRFIEGEFLNQLVVTLYPADKGYTLALKIQNALENETALIPYEEDELLNCIDNQQLPPVLIEILEEAGAQVFYDGCVFVEVRDLRAGKKTSWNVLLKPTPQTILADAQQICQEQGWGQEELLHIESILCMAMSEPLCLSPNPAVGELAVNNDSAAKQMHSTPLRQSRRSWCESRKRKQAEASQSLGSGFKLHDFLKKKSLLKGGVPPIVNPTIDQPNDSPPSSSSSSSPPVQIDVSDVLRLAKPLERPKEITDCTVIPFEEYLYETDRVNGRVYLVRLTIFQRPATDEFLGQLYVDRDYRDNNSTGGASCMFSLGTRWSVQRYLQQFTEIFTEEGRKAVKITHQVANQPPRVMYTQSMREKERQREKEEQQQQLLQQQQVQQQQMQQQQQTPQQVQMQRQQPQAAATAQPAAASKEPTETMHVNIASIPVKTENIQGQTVQAKAAWIDGLKAGQVNPALASLVSSLISSAQQPQQQQQQQQAQIQIQQQPIRPAGATANANVVIANGHHQQQQQPQSLLRPASVRPQATGNIATAALGQNVQLVTANYIQQPGQQRPAGTVRPGTALAALLTNSKAAALPANISPGKGKIVQAEVRAAGAGPSSTPSANTILMGQLVRAANSGSTPVLPSYTQAIGQTASGATVVRAIRPAVQGSTITGTIVRRQGESVAINGTGGTQRISLTVPALSALLAGTPSADSPNSNSAPANQNVPSLLERLQQQSSPNKPAGAALNNNHNQIHAIKSNLAASNNNINVQSINLTNVQGTVTNLPLQSIQVSIPRLGVPITLSLAMTSSATSSVSTASVVGSVRLTNSSGGLATAGQPISIPLSVLQQIPNAAGATGVQLVGNVSTKDGTIVPQLKVAGNSNAGSASLASSGGQSSGSLLAQQQLQIALQRQVQMQLQQKVAAKQKSKPPNS